MLKLNSTTFTTGRDCHKVEYTFSVGETVTLGSGHKAVIKNLFVDNDSIFAELKLDSDALLYISVELLATVPENKPSTDNKKEVLDDVKKHAYAGEEFSKVVEAYETYKKASDNVLNSMLKFISKGDTPGIERMQFDLNRGLNGVYTK